MTRPPTAREGSDAAGTSPGDPARPHVFRPSWAAFHRRLLSRMLLLGPLFVIVVLVAAWPHLGLSFMMLGAVLVLGGLALAVYFSRAEVEVDAVVVRVRGALRTRRWPRRDIAALVFVPRPGAPGASASRVTPANLYAVSHTHTRLFWLSGEAWERSVLDEIVAAIGAPLHEAHAGLSQQEIASRYPGTLGWTNLHPWRLALLLMGVSLVVMMLIAVAAAIVLIVTGQVPLPVRSS